MKQKRTCPKGHVYFKSTDCPACPFCEEERKSATGFLSSLSAPARRALENAGIKTLRQLSAYTKAEILKLHGMGPASIPKLNKALDEAGFSWK
jgi:predicted RecB family nuclease